MTKEGRRMRERKRQAMRIASSFPKPNTVRNNGK
jgi:hypothetical protein